MKRAVIVISVLVALTAVGAAQGQRATTLDDVIAEIRALRADLNQTSTVTVRTQLLVARLSLQEQRITAVAKQLNDAQALLTTLQPGNTMMANQIKDEEERLTRTPASERVDREEELKQIKTMHEQGRAREQALRSQINELSTMLSTEQNRWSEFNDRIDRSDVTGMH